MKFLSRALAASLLLGIAGAPAIAQGPPPSLPPEVLADEVDAARAAYLARHVVADGPVVGGYAFSFPKAFYDGRLFLLGESHGSAAPQVLDLELLTHLNARIGLTDYLAEVDPVQAEWLNRYLATGDEALLDRVFDVWNSGAQWANVAFENKVRGIRTLNLSLPQERRIRMHGIDAIQDWPLLVEALGADGVALELDALMAMKGAARARAAADALAASLRSKDRAYLLAALERQAAGSDRESTIFGNYAELVRHGALKKRPAYGLWGIAHVLQGPVQGTPRFAGMVRDSDLPTASGVRSIAVYGLDSAVQFPVPLPDGIGRVRFMGANIDGPTVKLSGSATLREVSKPGRLVVFDVAAKGSPYAQGQQLVALRSSMDPGIVAAADVPTTGYVQYVGVYRDSDWAAPREGAGRVITP